MKFAPVLLLAVTLVAVAAAKPSSATRFKLTKAQIQEFDETGWVTLTPSQKAELQRRTGIAPTQVQPIYVQPEGEVAELGYNLALKTAVDEIKVLPDFLMSDEDAAKKHQQNLQMIARGGGTTMDIPSFAIDADGKLWKLISRKEFEDYIAHNPKNIMIVYVQTPSTMPSNDTVAAADSVRQVTDYCKRQSVPIHVISKHLSDLTNQ